MEYFACITASIAARSQLDYYNRACCELVSTYIAVQCELGDPNCMQYLITEHSSLLPNSKGKKRRLDLALAEYHLRFGDYDAAQEILERLQIAYAEDPVTYANGVPMNQNKVHHYRRAWPLAFESWEKVYQVAQLYGWAEGYYVMTIQFSLGHAYFSTGQRDSGNHAIAAAWRTYSQLGRQY